MKKTSEPKSVKSFDLAAEAKLQAALTRTDLLRLEHELEVDQIELEMQNDELGAVRTELEASLDRYTDLFDFARRRR